MRATVAMVIQHCSLIPVAAAAATLHAAHNSPWTDRHRKRERERERESNVHYPLQSIPLLSPPCFPSSARQKTRDNTFATTKPLRQDPATKKNPRCYKKPTTNPRLIRQNLPVSKPPLLPKKPLRQTPYDKPSSASATKLTLLQKNPNDKFSQNKTTCNKNLNRPCDKAHLHVCFNKKSELMRMRRATASV